MTALFLKARIQQGSFRFRIKIDDGVRIVQESPPTFGALLPKYTFVDVIGLKGTCAYAGFRSNFGASCDEVIPTGIDPRASSPLTGGCNPVLPSFNVTSVASVIEIEQSMVISGPIVCSRNVLIHCRADPCFRDHREFDRPIRRRMAVQQTVPSRITSHCRPYGLGYGRVSP